MSQLTGLLPTAVPTARDAPGRCNDLAMSPYVVTPPSGMRSSASQTFNWKFVPFTCSESGVEFARPPIGNAFATAARVAD